MKSRNRETNFDVDLLPVISILAVCICFLLMVVSWSPMAVIKTDQAFGESSNRQNVDNPPSVFAAIRDDGDLDLTLKDAQQAPAALTHLLIQGRGGKVDSEQLDVYLKQLKSSLPEIKMAVVMPHHASRVDEVIQVMDRFRKNAFSDVGVSPF